MPANEAPSRPTVLPLLGFHLPGYNAGDSIRSIVNLVAAIGLGFHFRIVPPDRDSGNKPPFPGIVVNRWDRVGQADVMYLRPEVRCLLCIYLLLRSVGRHAVLPLNSFWAGRGSMLPVLMRRYKLCRLRRR